MPAEYSNNAISVRGCWPTDGTFKISWAHHIDSIFGYTDRYSRRGTSASLRQISRPSVHDYSMERAEGVQKMSYNH